VLLLSVLHCVSLGRTIYFCTSALLPLWGCCLHDVWIPWHALWYPGASALGCPHALVGWSSDRHTFTCHALGFGECQAVYVSAGAAGGGGGAVQRPGRVSKWWGYTVVGIHSTTREFGTRTFTGVHTWRVASQTPPLPTNPPPGVCPASICFGSSDDACADNTLAGTSSIHLMQSASAPRPSPCHMHSIKEGRMVAPAQDWHRLGLPKQAGSHCRCCARLACWLRPAAASGVAHTHACDLASCIRAPCASELNHPTASARMPPGHDTTGLETPSSSQLCWMRPTAFAAAAAVSGSDTQQPAAVET
jgi:hypothetical protein